MHPENKHVAPARIKPGLPTTTALGSRYSTKELAWQLKIITLGTYTWRENSSLGEDPLNNKAVLVKE